MKNMLKSLIFLDSSL